MRNARQLANKRRKPLLLTGVRQCGKTYTVTEFAKKYFSDFVYINFEKKYKPEIGYKISGKNIAEGMCEGTKTYSLPLYMCWRIEK